MLLVQLQSLIHLQSNHSSNSTSTTNILHPPEFLKTSFTNEFFQRVYTSRELIELMDTVPKYSGSSTSASIDMMQNICCNSFSKETLQTAKERLLKPQSDNDLPDKQAGQKAFTHKDESRDEIQNISIPKSPKKSSNLHIFLSLLAIVTIACCFIGISSDFFSFDKIFAKITHFPTQTTLIGQSINYRLLQNDKIQDEKDLKQSSNQTEYQEAASGVVQQIGQNQANSSQQVQKQITQQKQSDQKNIEQSSSSQQVETKVTVNQDARSQSTTTVENTNEPKVETVQKAEEVHQSESSSSKKVQTVVTENTESQSTTRVEDSNEPKTESNTKEQVNEPEPKPQKTTKQEQNTENPPFTQSQQVKTDQQSETTISLNRQSLKNNNLPSEPPTKPKKPKTPSIIEQIFKIAPSIQLPPKDSLQSLTPQPQAPIQWPQQDQLYHIYSALNPRLVLDVAVANDGYHDLILYDWKNQLNQMYYFRKVKDNWYHIINAQSKEYMKKSEKYVQPSNVSKIKFSAGEDKLWQLIPAKPNVKNSFYIVSEDDMALDLNQGYAQLFAEIIQFNFHKLTNQVWILRKNISSMAINQTSIVKFEEKASELLYNVMNVRDSINECITLEEMKLQMNDKSIPLPSWLKKPEKHKVNEYDLPLQSTQDQFRKQEQKMITSQWRQQQQQQVDYEDDADNATQIVQKPNFTPEYVALQCARRHKVAYIWYGTNTMPEEYQYLLRKCQDNVVILTETEFEFYSEQWNTLASAQYQITPQVIPIRQRVNILKLLYLYFEAGIYADFDTQINEQCFADIFANEIIFTNRVQQNINIPLIFPVEQIVVPEQSFMMVRKPFHPQVKRMIQEEIKEHDNGGGDRWRECKYRQCLIVECQRHYRDNTYKKGYV